MNHFDCNAFFEEKKIHREHDDCVSVRKCIPEYQDLHLPSPVAASDHCC